MAALYASDGRTGSTVRLESLAWSGRLSRTYYAQTASPPVARSHAIKVVEAHVPRANGGLWPLTQFTVAVAGNAAWQIFAKEHGSIVVVYRRERRWMAPCASSNRACGKVGRPIDGSDTACRFDAKIFARKNRNFKAQNRLVLSHMFLIQMRSLPIMDFEPRPQLLRLRTSVAQSSLKTIVVPHPPLTKTVRGM